MIFNKFKTWIKSHRAFHFTLIALFLFGIYSPLIGAVGPLKNSFHPVEYTVIDINFDSAKVDAEEIGEGSGVGTSRYNISLNKKGTTDLISLIRNKPNDIYLINLKGTTPINEHSMLGEKFAINLYGICGLEAAEAVGVDSDLEGFCESVILHFPSQETINSWSSFSESPTSCCDSYFSLKGFYSFSFFRDKQDNSNQYQARNIEPDTTIAKRTIKSQEGNKYYQLYVDDWKD